MSTIATAPELLDRMVEEVFNESDPEKRSAAIGELFTEQMVFTDTHRSARGRDEFAATVTDLLAEGPGFVFTHTGPYRGVGELGMREWSLGPVGAQPVVAGLDVVLVEDGRIARLWTILGGETP
jgi:hypothetical protein